MAAAELAPRDRRSHPGVPARPERRHVARRLADLRRRADAVPPDAGGARAARFLRRARAGGRAAEGDGRVRAEPLQARSAVPARARRRVPGHEPGAVGARRAARQELGRGPRRRGRRASRRRSSSSAIESSRSTAFGTRTSRCSTRPPDSSARFGRTAMPRRAISVSFRAVPALLAFVNDVFDAIDKAPERRDAFRYGDADRFPGRRRGDPTTRPAPLGLDRGRRDHALPPIVSRTRSCGLLAAAHWSAIARPALRRPGAAGRHRDPVPVARQPPRVREGARAPRRVRPTSTRASASSTPTRCRTRSRSCAIWPIRCRTCARRRSCGRASSGSPIRRVARARAVAGAARSSSRRAAGGRGVARRGRRSRCWRGSGRPCRAGCRGSIACRRLELLDRLLAETAYAFETRGPGRRQARENLKKLRGMVGALPEPRLCDACARRRSPRRAGRRRRVERGDRRRATRSA